MGALAQLNRWRRRQQNRVAAVAYAREIEKWYATHPLSPWQRDNVQKIRDVHEEKQEALRAAHDNAASRVSDEFAAFELEYLRTSHAMKEKDPNVVVPFDGNGLKAVVGKAVGIISKAFAMK